MRLATKANPLAHKYRIASNTALERLAKLGVRVQASTGAELQTLLASETRRWDEVIRAARIEPE